MDRSRRRRGITEGELKKIERTDIIGAAKQDRDWWSAAECRFATPEERDAAIEEGLLTNIAPTDKFFFSSDIRTDQKLQFLRHDAKALLTYVIRELDKRTNFSARGIKLILNSLHRCDDVQNELVNGDGWYRAAPVGTSSHAAGAAFDINVRTHYVKSADGIGWIGTWKDEAKEQYASDVIEDLAMLLAELSEIGICNFISENYVEGDEYEPTCFHVCVSPDAFLFLPYES